MTRMALALAAIISTAALATPAEAGCRKLPGGLLSCEITKSNTELGTRPPVRNFGDNGAGPTFRVTLEWMEEEPVEPDAPSSASWCSLVVTYSADPGQNIGQISVAHTSTWTLTSDGESRLLTAGREALLIDRAAVWLTSSACSAGLSAIYTKNAARLFR